MIFLPFLNGATCWEAQFGRLWIRVLKPHLWHRVGSKKTCGIFWVPRHVWVWGVIKRLVRITWCDKDGSAPYPKYRK